jgi:hypothetical protein
VSIVTDMLRAKGDVPVRGATYLARFFSDVTVYCEHHSCHPMVVRCNSITLPASTVSQILYTRAVEALVRLLLSKDGNLEIRLAAVNCLQTLVNASCEFLAGYTLTHFTC